MRTDAPSCPPLTGADVRMQLSFLPGRASVWDLTKAQDNHNLNRYWGMRELVLRARGSPSINYRYRLTDSSYGLLARREGWIQGPVTIAVTASGMRMVGRRRHTHLS